MFYFSMKTIPLTQGKVAIVDDEDFEWLSKWNWCCQKNRNCIYAKRAFWKNKKRRCIWMHREIIDAQKGKVVNHIDFNGLNNQKKNLQLCTCRENNRWRRKMRGCTSRYKGVSWSTKDNVWVSIIHVDDTVYYLGGFKKEEDAAIAYNRAAIRYFGDFAFLNDITSSIQENQES